MVRSLAQLSDVQFIGYRDIFADINKILCPDLSFKKIKEDVIGDGGLLGIIYTLANRTETLSRKVNTLEEDVSTLKFLQTAREQTSQIMTSEDQWQPINIGDINDIINNVAFNAFVRDIAAQVATEIFKTKINGLHISYAGGDFN